MIDHFSPVYEDLMIRHMPKFADMENKRATKVWGMETATGKQAVQNGGRQPVEIDPEQHAEAARRFRAGDKFHHIMQDLKLSKYALSRILAAEGLRQFPAGDLPKKARIIRDMLRKGAKLSDIAAHLKISRQAVSDWIRRYGIDKW
jgi:DNA-binding NarL/FixJ family response regulator